MRALFRRHLADSVEAVRADDACRAACRALYEQVFARITPDGRLDVRAGIQSMVSKAANTASYSSKLSLKATNMKDIVDGGYVINPTHEERKKSLLDLIVAGSNDGIVMVEAGAKEVTEEQTVAALEAAHAAIKEIVKAIEEKVIAATAQKVTPIMVSARVVNTYS